MREEERGNRERGSGKAWLCLALAAVTVLMVVMIGRIIPNAPQSHPNEIAFEESCGVRVPVRPITAAPAGGVVPNATQSQEDETASDEDSVDNDEPQTEDEKREAEETKLVDAFDDLTDKWREPSAKGVTMADIDNFVKSFRKIPKARQDECIHRALNLIPDENVMLLAGVLMDKTMGKEIVATVYNDILNRDEDVKKPILQEIFKDKSHPCWADTAWILDVTGELPKAK